MKRIRSLLIILGATVLVSIYLTGWNPFPVAPPQLPIKLKFQGHPRPPHPPIPGYHPYVDKTITHTA